MPTGIRYGTLVHQLGAARHGEITTPLQWMHAEAHETFAPTPKPVDKERVKRRCACASVNLGLDGRDLQLR
jgi:hypothetical protein